MATTCLSHSHTPANQRLLPVHPHRCACLHLDRLHHPPYKRPSPDPPLCLPTGGSRRRRGRVRAHYDARPPLLPLYSGVGAERWCWEWTLVGTPCHVPPCRRSAAVSSVLFPAPPRETSVSSFTRQRVDKSPFSLCHGAHTHLTHARARRRTRMPRTQICGLKFGPIWFQSPVAGLETKRTTHICTHVCTGARGGGCRIGMRDTQTGVVAKHRSSRR